MNTDHMHDTIAADAMPNGVWLRCVNSDCDRGERVSRAQCAHYLATGWPTHCGYTMRISTPPPRPAGA